MSNTIKLLCLTYVILAISVIIVAYFIIKNHNKKKYRKILDTLEREKNLIINANILSELSKVENMINSKEIENQYNDWKQRFDSIKNVDIPALTDHLIQVEDLFVTKKYKDIEKTLAKIELMIYHVKIKANYLLDEIRNLTRSEEKNRETVTKLKGKYRHILNVYHEHEHTYALIKNPVKMQFETIDKLFSAFEIAMEKNAFSDISKIIKALDDSINNLDLVMDEAPEIILLGFKLIPKKMDDVMDKYISMVKQGFNLDYLSIESNIDEAKKKIADIFDRLNVLNLEDSSLELKTISNYFDEIYNDFDKERLCKKSFNEIGRSITVRTNKLSSIAKNLTNKIDVIKSTYNIDEENLKGLNIISISIRGIREDYDMLESRAENKAFPYSKLNKEVEHLNEKLAKIEVSLDQILRLINGYKADEKRAKEQLDEIKLLLANSKEKIKQYKLPIIPKKYYVELSEATEAINDMVTELEKKPLNIEVLNTRVDTARDLTLKLYKTTSETIKTASMSEHAIMYGNRFRYKSKKVDEGLTKAEDLFYKGLFKASLENAINALNIVEPGIHDKLLKDLKSRKGVS